MNLLITTSQSFLLLDSSSGQAHVLDRGHGLYYGIAHHGEHIFVAARNRLVSSTSDPADERGEVLMFDRSLALCQRLQAPFPLRDLHEIAWHDGKLWLTSSYDNMIAIWDGKLWERWYPLGVQEAGDVHHFNSFLFDQGLVWILAHNRGPSELLGFSLATRELVRTIPMGNCAHNIWRENGELYSCSSAESRLLGADGFVLDTGGFPRGVAFDASTRCVGISALTERKLRDFTSGKVMVFERDWSPRHEIDMAGEGLILDLCRLPPGFGLPAAARAPTLWTGLARLYKGEAPVFARQAPPQQLFALMETCRA